MKAAFDLAIKELIEDEGEQDFEPNFLANLYKFAEELEKEFPQFADKGLHAVVEYSPSFSITIGPLTEHTKEWITIYYDRYRYQVIQGEELMQTTYSPIFHSIPDVLTYTNSLLT